MVVPSRVVVVAAPKLVGTGPIQSVAELADYPWLQEIGTNEATRYLEQNGVTKGIRKGLISLPGNLMIDAARDGQGVATLARAFIEADIAAGRLRVLFADDERAGYFLVTPEGVLRPAAKAFAQWVMRQAAAGLGAGY
ncbi:glycine cleavage system transcriptional activator [mine drainage metagenome]|uniref:Glycine cleavage system transcriptional activator n=1 Tax=mine drainage metagenome TaxID=410659 RepID=A0A1J5PRT2_9ZZZZ